MTTIVATTVAEAMKAMAATVATVVATVVTAATVPTTTDDTRSKEPCRKDRRTVELGQAARKAAVPRSLGAQGSGATAALHAAQATK